MALGFIRKVFSFGKDKVRGDGCPGRGASPPAAPVPAEGSHDAAVAERRKKQPNPKRLRPQPKGSLGNPAGGSDPARTEAGRRCRARGPTPPLAGVEEKAGPPSTARRSRAERRDRRPRRARPSRTVQPEHPSPGRARETEAGPPAREKVERRHRGLARRAPGAAPSPARMGRSVPLAEAPEPPGRAEARHRPRRRRRTRADRAASTVDEIRRGESGSRRAGVQPAPAVAGTRTRGIERLRKGLSRSSEQLGQNISGIFTRRKLDEDTLRRARGRADPGRSRHGDGDPRHRHAVDRPLRHATSTTPKSARSWPPRSRRCSARRQAAGARPFLQAACHPRRRRQRHRQDDDDRQARRQARRGRLEGHARRRRHIPRRGDRAAADLGRAHRLDRWSRPSSAPMRRGLPTTPGRRPRRSGSDVLDHRHRRPAPEQDRADGGTRQDRPRSRQARSGRAAHRASDARCDHRPERAEPGRDLQERGRRERPRHDQARRHGARRHSRRPSRPSTSCRSISSASAKASTISNPSRRSDFASAIARQSASR